MKIRTLIIMTALATGIGAGQAQMTTFVTDNFTSNQVGPTTSPGTITPEFARSGALWTVNAGTFASDGQSVGNFGPLAGRLNFGTTAGTAITLNFGTGILAGDMEIKLDLRQSNATGAFYQFRMLLLDNAGQSYRIDMVPQLAYNGSTTGFLATSGTDLANGANGSRLNSSSSWQTLTLAFNPTTGFVMSSSSYGSPVLSFDNWRGSSYIQSMQLENENGSVSWFVDNVEVQAVPEPSTVLLLGLGMAALVMLRRHRRSRS